MRRASFARVGLRRIGEDDGGGGGSITEIDGIAPIHVTSGTGPTVTISHDASGVGAGAVAYPTSITFDAKGHATAAAAGTQPVGSVGATAPITNTGTATAPVIAHADSGVGAGPVAYPTSITFDAKGHATAAAAGTQPVGSLAVTAPITNTGTATAPNVGHANSTLGASTIVYPQSITFDAKGHPTAAVASLNSAQQTSRTKAIALLGSTDLYEYFADFDEVQPASGTAPRGWSIDQNNGTVTLNATTEVGGTVTQAISAAANGRCNLYNTAGGVRPGTKDLYVSFRMAVTGGGNNLSQNGMGITTTSFSQQLIAGYLGNFSTGNFGIGYNGQTLPPSYGGLFLNLGVAFDALYHLFEFWIIGTTLAGRIDSGSIQTAGTAISGYTASGFTSQLQGGSSSIARSQDVSWFYAACIR